MVLDHSARKAHQDADGVEHDQHDQQHQHHQDDLAVSIETRARWAAEVDRAVAAQRRAAREPFDFWTLVPEGVRRAA